MEQVFCLWAVTLFIVLLVGMHVGGLLVWALCKSTPTTERTLDMLGDCFLTIAFIAAVIAYGGLIVLGIMFMIP